MRACIFALLVVLATTFEFQDLSEAPETATAPNVATTFEFQDLSEVPETATAPNEVSFSFGKAEATGESPQMSLETFFGSSFAPPADDMEGNFGETISKRCEERDANSSPPPLDLNFTIDRDTANVVFANLVIDPALVGVSPTDAEVSGESLYRAQHLADLRDIGEEEGRTLRDPTRRPCHWQGKSGMAGEKRVFYMNVRNGRDKTLSFAWHQTKSFSDALTSSEISALDIGLDTDLCVYHRGHGNAKPVIIPVCQTDYAGCDACECGIYREQFFGAPDTLVYCGTGCGFVKCASDDLRRGHLLMQTHIRQLEDLKINMVLAKFRGENFSTRKYCRTHNVHKFNGFKEKVALATSLSDSCEDRINGYLRLTGNSQKFNSHVVAEQACQQYDHACPARIGGGYGAIWPGFTSEELGEDHTERCFSCTTPHYTIALEMAVLKKETDPQQFRNLSEEAICNMIRSNTPWQRSYGNCQNILAKFLRYTSQSNQKGNKNAIKFTMDACRAGCLLQTKVAQQLGVDIKAEESGRQKISMEGHRYSEDAFDDMTESDM